MISTRLKVNSSVINGHRLNYFVIFLEIDFCLSCTPYSILNKYQDCVYQQEPYITITIQLAQVHPKSMYRMYTVRCLFLGNSFYCSLPSCKHSGVQVISFSSIVDVTLLDLL